MEKEQLKSALKELLEQKIEYLKIEFQKTLNFIENINNTPAQSSTLAFPLSMKPKQVNSLVKKSKPLKKEVPGNDKISFSKYLLALFAENPDKDYDLAELGNLLYMAIESGRVSSVAGKVKDGISKRLYQFIKRKDLYRTINGTYQFNPRRGLNPEID